MRHQQGPLNPPEQRVLGGKFAGPVNDKHCYSAADLVVRMIGARLKGYDIAVLQGTLC